MPNGAVTLCGKHCETGFAIAPGIRDGGLTMKAWLFSGMLVALAVPAIASASPEAPSTPEELEADRAYIRSLNLRELAYVRQRDAARAQQQEAGREAQEQYEAAYDDYVRSRSDYLSKRNSYESAMDDYVEQRRSYESKIAAWRSNVAACRARQESDC